jgi:hypothetical protein
MKNLIKNVPVFLILFLIVSILLPVPIISVFAEATTDTSLENLGSDTLTEIVPEVAPIPETSIGSDGSDTKDIEVKKEVKEIVPVSVSIPVTDKDVSFEVIPNSDSTVSADTAIADTVDVSVDADSPTICERADINNDGVLNSTDFSDFQTAFDNSDTGSDFDLNGFKNANDFQAFINAYAQCPHEGVPVSGNNGNNGGDVAVEGGNGGGGGGSSGGGRRFTNVAAAGEVLGASTVNIIDPGVCNYLNGYLKQGGSNDMVEVMKLQSFLKANQGFSNLQVNGIFDDATFKAVSDFQKNNGANVLKPWGYNMSQSTGYVYITTQKRINELFCRKEFPLSIDQQNEIVGFRSMNANAGVGK